MNPVIASALIAATVALLSPPADARADPVTGDATGHQARLLDRIEAKWRSAMIKVRGWTPDSFRQFREGYAGYPEPVLEKALSAISFEEVQETLDAHAAVQARDAMAKAFRKSYPVGLTLPEDGDHEQVAEAKRLAAKALGDDARDLVFIPITPCTVWDTRFASNPDSAGIINNAQTKKFYSHLDGAGGSYAAYGGNPSCPETSQNFIGPRPFAVMMTVYVNDASANGWLTFYRDGDPDPSSATISVYYSPGPTRTQTVITKSSRGYGSGTYDIAATSRFGNANASASITGYFVKAQGAGTVTSVATGAGLTGGPITTSGTVGLASTNRLPTSPCAASQMARWTGSAWECVNAPAAVMAGRIDNPGGQVGCTVGAATGYSATASCNGSGVVARSAANPLGMVFRNLRVRLDAPASADALFSVIAGTTSFQCVVSAGLQECQNPGPSSAIGSTGEPNFHIEFGTLGVIPPVSFKYELTPP